MEDEARAWALRFAEAIADTSRGAGVYGSYEQVRFGSIHDAIASGGAYFVWPRAGAIACDVDVSEGTGDAAWAERIRSFARTECFHLIEVASGRPGHLHLWLICPVGWKDEEAAQRLGDLGVKDRGKVRHSQPTRPPFAPHKSGTCRRALPVSPSNPGRALDLFTRRPGLVPLEGDWEVGGDMLRDTEPPAGALRLGKPARSIHIQNIGNRWVRAGRTFEQFKSAMTDPAHGAGEKYRTRGSGRNKWLTNLWEDCRKWVRDNPANDTRRDQERAFCIQLRTNIDLYDWSHRGGISDRLLLIQLLEIGAAAATASPACDKRRLSRLTGLSESTVRAALGRLTDSKHLQPHRGPVGHPQAYELLQPEDAPSVLQTFVRTPISETFFCSKQGTTNGLVSVTFEDVFTNGVGLGQSCRLTYFSLNCTEWKTTADVVAAHPAQPSPRTVREHLKKLHQHGYARPNESKRRWKRIEPDEKHHRNVAQKLGVTNRTERISERHVREQNAYYERFGRICFPGEPRTPPEGGLELAAPDAKGIAS